MKPANPSEIVSQDTDNQSTKSGPTFLSVNISINLITPAKT